MDSIVAVVAALACYRLSMLVTRDSITQPWRDRLTDRFVYPLHEDVDPDDEGRRWPYARRCRCGVQFVGDEWSDVAMEMNGHQNPLRGQMSGPPKWLELLDCPWCVSVWIGAPVAWSAWCFGARGWWFVPAAALAFSAATGIVATFAAPQSHPKS